MAEVGDLIFVQWNDLYKKERPFMAFIDPPPDAKDQRVTNLLYEDHQIHFQDLRERRKPYSIDDEGFAYITHETNVEDFENATTVESEYFSECRDILQNHVTGVDDIYFFDWRVSLSVSFIALSFLFDLPYLISTPLSLLSLLSLGIYVTYRSRTASE